MEMAKNDFEKKSFTDHLQKRVCPLKLKDFYKVLFFIPKRSKPSNKSLSSAPII